MLVYDRTFIFRFGRTTERSAEKPNPSAERSAKPFATINKPFFGNRETNQCETLILGNDLERNILSLSHLLANASLEWANYWVFAEKSVK